MTPITPGLQVGRYIVRSKLGAGGMAEVYLADDTQLGRKVALKFLPPETEADAIAQRRLLREARAAATLDHPHICSVFEVDEAGGRTFIAMQFVDGETLDARLRRSRLELHETLAIAVQVVDAMSEAHAHGILHRDIKPSNVMVTTRGHARVMDFGLAKYADDAVEGGAETMSLLSARGDIVGTAPYMSPEAGAGERLDPRSDLFSVGVLIYEMVTGQRPFQGGSSAAVAAAILTQDPPPLARFAPSTPQELDRIVSKLLKKDPDSRYQTAKDLLIDLRALKEEQDFQHKLGRTPPPTGSLDRGSAVSPAASERQVPAPSTASPAAAALAPSRSWRPLVIVAVLALIAGGGWYAWRASNVRSARAQLTEIAALGEEKKYFEAYDRATAIQPYLRGDPALAAVMASISLPISVTTTPPGASVYATRFVPDAASTPARQLLGTTPLTDARVARGDYLLQIEKDGFAPIELAVGGLSKFVGTAEFAPKPVRIDQQLLPTSANPAGMVFVPGGDYRLASWSRPTDRRVTLSDFFIDKYEVSNREFKEFVTGGGYLKRDLWPQSFVKDGRTLSWDDAMKLLVDRSGLPGPRSWSNQAFADSKADYAVTDISWYEAAAYAAFRGKQLPTVFQWEKAARGGVLGPAGLTVMPWGLFVPGDALSNRANFGAAPLPVSSSPFGISVYGAQNMAGNVVEWTRNDSSEGFLATGGGWGDPTYTFSQFGGRPGFFTSDKLGFRCAQSASADAKVADQGSERIDISDEVPVYTPSSTQQFNALAAAYRYAKTPLDARIDETTETPDWKREKVSYNGANAVRAVAYLYLPNHVPRPLQVLHYMPAADVDGGFRPLEASIEERMAPLIKSGRAVFGVVLDGYVGRLRPNVARPQSSTAEFSDFVVNRLGDLQRALDYLETRPDIDTTRMAAFAPSAGSALGLILGAIEPRYRALVFVGAGLPASYRAITTSANPIYFAPHIKAPKLLVQGRYDEDTPLRTATEPLFKLMVEPKTLVLYEGGHVPSVQTTMSATSGWLDEKLGRVTR